MIESAEEFVRLRTSELQPEYWRAAHEEASLDVWLEVIARFPDMREWVAHNKTVPFEILTILATDSNATVRRVVATKRKLKHMQLQVIESLAADCDESVRALIARRRDLPREVIEPLRNDDDSFVSDIARANLAARDSQP